MNTIMTYLLQLLLCSGLLYFFYILFLKSKKEHQFNRFYLLSSFLVSILAPAIKIPLYILSANNPGIGMRALLRYNELMLSEVAVSTNKNTMEWQSVLVALVLGVSLCFIIRILLGIGRLLNMRIHNSAEKRYGITVINTKNKAAPFSFFHWLFWDLKKDRKSPEAESIWQHELCHIKQLHSADILFSELITAIAWMNPFYWMMKNELKLVHEFEADAYAAIAAGELKYAEYLITEAIAQKQPVLVNPFFNNQFKRRIAMLTQQTKQPGNRYRKWIAFPFFIATAIFFITSCQQKDASPGLNSQHANSADKALSAKMIANPDIEARYGGDWGKYLATNLKAEVATDNGAGPGNYQVIVQFIVDVNGNVSDAKLVKDPGYGMGTEALRVIQSSGKWKPALLNGHPVKAYRKQPITYSIQEG